MIDGQTKEVVCRADQAYPKPTFLWTLGHNSLLSQHRHPPSLSTSLQENFQPATSTPPPTLVLPNPPDVERSHLHYWVSSSSSIMVTPSLLHHNSTLSCTILPSKETIALPLLVEAYLPPQLHAPVPTSSGFPLLKVLLLLPLLLLVLLFCCFCVTRRRREGSAKDYIDEVV